MSLNKKFRGVIVLESLENVEQLESLSVVEKEDTAEENPADRWHIYTVDVTDDEISQISKNLKKGKWYAHFWSGDDLIVAFRDKIFKSGSDEASQQPAIKYGLSIGIPQDQLVFVKK
jgi:hypothetical protein